MKDKLISYFFNRKLCIQECMVLVALPDDNFLQPGDRVQRRDCAIQPFKGFCSPILIIQDCHQEDTAGGRAGTQVLWGAAGAFGVVLLGEKEAEGSLQCQDLWEWCWAVQGRLDWVLESVSVPRGWADIGTGFIEEGLLPQACQCLKSICKMSFTTFCSLVSLELARQSHRMILSSWNTQFHSVLCACLLAFSLTLFTSLERVENEFHTSSVKSLDL